MVLQSHLFLIKKVNLWKFMSKNLDMINSPENSIAELLFDNYGDLKKNYKNINIIKNPYLNTILGI